MSPAIALDDDPLLRRWGRRAVTIPMVHLGLALGLGLLPLLLPLALLRDGRGRRLATTRAALMGAWYLCCEVWGLWAALALWLGTAGGLLRGPFLAGNYALQRAWSDALFAGMRRLYAVHVELEADEAGGDRPFLLLLRHASLPDVLLPAVGWANRRKVRLRYVLKLGVTASPCLDVVGHRLPNAFVRRGGPDTAREVGRVLALHHGPQAGGPLRPGEGIVLYPEGTRYSPGKRQRLLDGLRARGDEAGLARAEAFHRVLPPRKGGPTALLAARRDGEDVVICAHQGTESALRAAALLDGSLVGRTFRIRAWRIPGEQVPREPDAALAWLDGWWHRVDAWVQAQEALTPGSAPPPAAPRST